MTVIRNEEAKIGLVDALRIADLSAHALLQAQEARLINPFPGIGASVRFTDLCLLYAFGRFVAAGIHFGASNELSGPETCAQIALLPMLSFAGELARARYDVRGPWVMTTHPDHVPERFVVHSGDAVCRVGSIAAYENVRRETSDQAPTIFIFDAKVAAEHLVDKIGSSPYEVVIEDESSKPANVG